MTKKLPVCKIDVKDEATFNCIKSNLSRLGGGVEIPELSEKEFQKRWNDLMSGKVKLKF